jgi:hypothetical protein
MRIPSVAGLSVREAAKLYIAAGFRVFPLAARSKNPAPGFVWNEQAWRTPEEVDAWRGEIHGLGLPLALNGLMKVITRSRRMSCALSSL